MKHAAKNTAFKNQLRNFLCDENQLYGIILVHLTSNVTLTTSKRLLAAEYRILKKSLKLEISSHSLTHSLPDHSRKPRTQMKQRTVTILCHNNKLTGRMCLLGFQRVCTLCTSSFLLSSTRLLVFFIKQNHIKVLIFYIITFFKQHNRCHKII